MEEIALALRDADRRLLALEFDLVLLAHGRPQAEDRRALDEFVGAT